ncbi:putative signal peptide-containing protein [Cryptosporidium canis]|uniref:Signal peptide-containing protein n=1 Tax=Cryptosporidium canis TaxID=195482 RepID=A0A9D5HVW9_9CRYT|nr:putative signal peptide-containing protein [Cryptosporidium canis]
MRLCPNELGGGKAIKIQFLIFGLSMLIFMSGTFFMLMSANKYPEGGIRGAFVELDKKEGVSKGSFEYLEELKDSMLRISLKLSESKDMFDTIGASLNKIAKYVEANEKNMTANEFIIKEESKNGFVQNSILFPCKYNFEGPVYILLTTTPKRINNLGSYLDLLHKQTYGIKEVILSIPYIFERTGEEYPPIPSYLQDKTRFPLLRILRGKDYGPATKFLLPIEIGNIPEDAGLVILDDDTRYSRHLVCDYIYVHEKFPQAVLGRRGQAFHDNCDPTYRTDRLHRVSHDQKSANFVIRSVDLLSGVGTYFLKKKFINKDILALKNNCPTETIKHMFFTDDILISGYLAYKNISRIAFSEELSREELNRPYMLGSGPGALWDINKQAFHNDNSTAAFGLYWGCESLDTIVSKHGEILCKWRNES